MLFICFATYSAELILVGNYQGKNLYVQNPLMADGENYSATEVYVNQGFLMHAPRASAFVINLSHLALNQRVEVKIIHDESAVPRIVNAYAIRDHKIYLDASYAPEEDVFRWTKADQDILRWSVYGEKKGGVFVVQRMKENEWENIDSLEVSDSTMYRFPVSHRTGKNNYRIKLIDRDGYVTWSDVFAYNAKENPNQFYPAKSKDAFDELTGVSYSPKKVQRAIRLSKKADYEIWSKDSMIFEGTGVIIDVKKLQPGEYYIKIGSHQGPFTKY